MSKPQSRMARRRQRSKKHKSLWKKIVLGLGITFSIIMITGAIAVAVIINGAPSLEASDLKTPQSTQIYDQDGKHISTLFREENRVRIDIDEVPDLLKNAVISIEDKRFYDHSGVDYHRLLGAVKGNIKKGWGSEGGSTLTQQVIKRSVLSSEKTLKRKIQEAWLSFKLEREYSKDEILEMYLNNVYFGHGAYGVKTASVKYFGKDDLSELNLAQVAMLAGLPNAPSMDDPFKNPERADKRRDKVLSAMASNQVITEGEAEEARSTSIADALHEGEDDEDDDPYNAFIDTVYDQLVKQEKVVSDDEFYQGGLNIYTTLDSDAQKAVYDLLHSDEIPYPDQNFETGISLVDTKTGAIKAVGGGRNFKAISYTNYASTPLSQSPGSTIKPIIDYGPAVEYLNWPTSHILSDVEYQYSNGTPIREWDGEYWGDVSMRRALEWSRNIPALKAFQAVGKEKVGEFSAGLGIDMKELIEPYDGHESIPEAAAIGGFDPVSPLQMAEAYAAFGNGGTYNEPFTVEKVTFPDGTEWEPDLKSNEAMHDYTAYMITDMLKTVVTSGTGTQANIAGIPVAGKTGSTNISKENKEKYNIDNGLRDSWFAGYTPQYSMAVWTGYPSMTNSDGDPQYIRYDGTQDIAKTLFRELMAQISDPNMSDFEKPDSVISIGSDLYVKGTEPQYQSPAQEPPQNNEQEDPEEDQENNDENEENETNEENNDENQENDEETNEENQENNEEQNENENENEDNQNNDEQKEDNDNQDNEANNGQNEDNQEDGNNEDNQNSGEDEGENNSE